MRKARTNEVTIYQLFILRNMTSGHTAQGWASLASPGSLLQLSSLQATLADQSVPCSYRGVSSSELIQTCTSSNLCGKSGGEKDCFL